MLNKESRITPRRIRVSSDSLNVLGGICAMPPGSVDYLRRVTV